MISWCTYSNHLISNIQLQFSKFSWISRAHEINKNVNPMEITNHTVQHKCIHFSVHRYMPIIIHIMRLTFPFLDHVIPPVS